MAAGLGAQSQAAQAHVRHPDTLELEDLEPRRRDQPTQLTAERRFRLNTLMVGAPLTAAFVGLMAADGGAAPDGAQTAGSEGATGARSDGDRAQPGQGAIEARAEEGLPTGSPGPLVDAGGAPGTEVSGAAEPTSTGDLAGAGAGIEPAPVLIPVQRTPADFAADETAIAGPQVSITFFGVQPFVAGDGQQDGEPLPPERGPIGTFVPGTDGDDAITGTEADDLLIGGAGDDEIRGLAGDDILEGGAGNDRLFGNAGADELIGGEGNDELHGGAGDDDLLAGVGDDTLFGGGGGDTLRGGEGNDLLVGGPGLDQMSGGPGDDIFVVDDIGDHASEDDNSPDAGGNDTLRVEQGFADSLLEFAGVSNAAFRFSIDTPLPSGVDGFPHLVDADIENIVLRGTANHAVIGDARDNVIRGNAGDNVLHGGAGDDLLGGGGGADRLLGGAGGDRLLGGANDDILAGAAGDDILRGDEGDDILRGGAGEDRLFGEAGDDAYVIGLNEADATDAIFDHEGVNHIRLEGAEGHLVQTALIGDQLRIIVDNNPTPFAVIDDYRGHEEAFSGIDFGDGIVPIADLLAVDDPDPDDPGPDDDPPGDDDILGEFILGTAGDDHLVGTVGDDTIEGGKGSDTLEGGAGEDRYLFNADDFDAEDTIRDHDGANVAELEGFSGASQLRAVEADGHLRVAVDGAILFKVQDFGGNDQAFAGVWVGETFVETEQLLEGWQPQ